jgi:uncharacterized protein (DUF305 family)
MQTRIREHQPVAHQRALKLKKPEDDKAKRISAQHLAMESQKLRDDKYIKEMEHCLLRHAKRTYCQQATSYKS